MTDREERQHVIEVLKSWDGYFIGYTSDEVQEALRYAIASIKTDLKYDLLYEETSEQADKQADKPTTKNDVPNNNAGNIYECSCGYGWDKTKVVRYHFCPNCGKAVEPTTKENLAVDCISRADARSLICNIDIKHHVSGMSRKAFKALYNGMDELPPVTLQEPRWIPVSERLPEVAGCYNVTRKSGDDLTVSACYFDGINNWHNGNWINYERNYLTDIIAWMPLPEPYKAKSEE